MEAVPHMASQPTGDTVAIEHLKRDSLGERGTEINRRIFLAGASLGAAGLFAGCGANNKGTITPDTDALNFALNLEYLEATFYSYLVNGSDLPADATGNSGTITGAPAKLSGLSQQATDLLNEIYFDELSHVNAIRSSLGPAAIARPNLNLGARGAITSANYLSVARLLEDVGVTAYAGAVTLFEASANTQAAAQIMSVEAFHAGALRLLHIQAGAAYSGTTPDGYDIKPGDPGTAALAQAGPTTANGGFFATAGATGATTAQTGTLPGMAYKRTPSQVLAILYGNAAAGTASGGFFPNGVNGNIKTV